LNGSLERELKANIEGEVRFDKISRALYSNDASVYQIEPAGVVIPRHREDLIRTIQICRRLRCPITMRGAGTSQAGQAIGEGVVIDTSKYFNRLLEVNADERWVRVEPGIVLDELNAQLASLGLRFAPDISTASRATIGGMMANNSSGARSVLYGKTIDHVLEQIVMLSDGSIAHFRDLARHEIPTGAAISESATPRRRLQSGRVHRPHKTSEPRENNGRVRRNAGRRARSKTAPGSLAESESSDGDRIHRSARSFVRDSDHSHAWSIGG
jgi:FAD/FMN-containing dehydrogenase